MTTAAPTRPRTAPRGIAATVFSGKCATASVSPTLTLSRRQRVASAGRASAVFAARCRLPRSSSERPGAALATPPPATARTRTAPAGTARTLLAARNPSRPQTTPMRCAAESAIPDLQGLSGPADLRPAPSTASEGSDPVLAVPGPPRARPPAPPTVASFGGSCTALAAMDPAELPDTVPTAAMRRRIARFTALAHASAGSQERRPEPAAMPATVT